jgi:hypothetical protein
MRNLIHYSRPHLLFSTTIVFLVLLLSTTTVPADILNGSFEDGLTGWTIGIGSSYIRGDYPYPASTIDRAQWNIYEDSVDGIFSAGRECPTGEEMGFIGPDNEVYSIICREFTLSQVVELQQGEILSGWGRYSFYNRVELFTFGNGNSRVTVGQETVWIHNINPNIPHDGDPNYGWARYDTGWEQWQYTVPTSGYYTIEIFLGSNLPWCGAEARFDGFTVVPEPTSCALIQTFGLVAFSFGSWCRRSNVRGGMRIGKN